MAALVEELVLITIVHQAEVLVLITIVHLMDIPDPGHICSDAIPSLSKEGLNELFNQLLVENVIEAGLVVGTLEGDRHESELKHVVLRLIAAGACLNLGKSCLKNLDLALIRGFGGDLNCTQGHKGLQVDWNVAEEVLEEVKQDLHI